MRAILALCAFLGVLTLVGCDDGENTSTDCGLNQCTVTFDRGVDANARVLGVEVTLVRVDGDVATLEVAGEPVQVSVDQSTGVGPVTVSLREITDDAVKVRIELTG